MNAKPGFRALLEKISQRRIFKILPHGLDFFADLERQIQGYTPGVIVDVGAGDGRYSQDFATRFPLCKIYALEPIEEKFTHLQKQVVHSNNVECHRLALSDQPGREAIAADYRYASNAGDSATGFSPVETPPMTETVDAVTLSRFCAERSIDRISYLRVDAERNDPKILAGARDFLAAAKIDFVNVKAAMNSGNKDFTSLECQKKALEAFDYGLFGIYRQALEWPTGEPRLRRANLVFISRFMIEQVRNLTPNGVVT